METNERERGNVNFIPFGSTAEMQEFLRKANEAADQNIHLLQSSLGFSDHWIRFHDLPTGMIEMGYVLTWQEVVDTEVEAGANRPEARHTADSAWSMLERNYMYGRAYSPLNPDGEYGITHKSSVWPIEKSVFDDFLRVKCQMAQLSQASKINVEHAFRAMRGHVRSRT